MIIPSIDIMNGRAVQLVGGERLEIDAGDPRPLAERFALTGEIAVIDLDAARGEGANAGVIGELLELAPCRVGGGIRDYQTAARWLDAGAEKIIIGTAATPDLLRRLPRSRIIAALDERDGSVVDHGWRRSTGRTVPDRMRELDGLVGGYLVTFINQEGRMTGLPIDRVEQLVEEARGARLVVAGGARTPDEIARADRLGADVQVGMALYSGRLDLADAISALLTSDRPDGLWPTVVADERGMALGLTYSNAQTLSESLRTRCGVYWSRSRQSIWRKGDTSGATQRLVRVTPDCDRDALLYTVEQHGVGFCHLGRRSCFGEINNLASVSRRIEQRVRCAASGSYTMKLVRDPEFLRGKLIEEAGELADARTPDEVAWEAADVLYFTLVAMARAGVPLECAERELHRRSLRITRRPGKLKTNHLITTRKGNNA